MRRAFIGFGLVVFAVYCWASVAYQNRMAIPDYRLVEVDILGGMTRAAWEADQRAQFQRLMALDGKKYQLPLDSTSAVPRDRPLTMDDFAKFVSLAPPGQGLRMQLRDTTAINSLLDRNYRLRDNIPDPGNPVGSPLFAGGAPLTRVMLDILRTRGVRTLTVTGHAAPVNFQVGTAIMIAIVFLTLVAAMKPIIWDPFLHLLERRRRELEMGNEAERQNQLEATRFEEERRRRHADLRRGVQEMRLKDQREAARQAGEILKAAREREKGVKIEGLRELAASAAGAGAELEGRVPELAEAVARALTPTRVGEPEEMGRES